MKITLPSFDDVDFADTARLKFSLRDLVNKIENAFQKIRLDDALIVGGGTPIKKHWHASATWNPASVASGAQTTTTISVANAVMGDEVTCSFDKDLQGMQLTGYVSSAGVVTVVLRNGTGSPIDLASGTLRASVWRH